MIRARALRKSFGKHDVLRGIDLEVAPGEVVGLIGPNGAGKTTLMSCLLGFLTPNGGSIEIDGRANDALDVRRQSGFVPERMNFDRRATGWAFLRYMARLAGVPASEVDARSKAMLERLAISDASNRRLSQYSRGMLQRIGMCQALIHEPKYIFLDEPASGLDPNGVLLVRDLINEQKQRGAAVLLSSHQLSEVEKICDRVLFLSGGLIAREETLRHVDHIVVAITLLPGSYEDATVARIAGVSAREHVVIATVASERAIAELVRELAASGAGILDVRQHKADLESIFRGAQ
ncbi:MAG TPA: ABC transporter ATP-binding protein [Thermoanaerobaculia bacterium]|nr:ABC transporter ATP-binding protein [Thermoanaerobaculia bacterium]